MNGSRNSIDELLLYFSVRSPLGGLKPEEKKQVLGRLEELEPGTKDLVDKVEGMISEYQGLVSSYANRQAITYFGLATAFVLVIGAVGSLANSIYTPFVFTAGGVGLALGLGATYFKLKVALPVKRKAQELNLALLKAQDPPEYQRSAVRAEMLGVMYHQEDEQTTNRSTVQRLLALFSRRYP